MTRIKRYWTKERRQNSEVGDHKFFTFYFFLFNSQSSILHSPFSIPIPTLAQFPQQPGYQSTRYSQLSTFGLTFQIYEMYEIREIYEMYEMYLMPAQSPKHAARK